MKQLVVTLYEFDELTQPAQARAIQDHREINVYWDWWDQDFLLDPTPDFCEAHDLESWYERYQEWAKESGKALLGYSSITSFDFERYRCLSFDGLEVNNEQLFHELVGINDVYLPYDFEDTIASRYGGYELTEMVFEAERDDEEIDEETQSKIDFAKGMFAQLVSAALDRLEIEYFARLSDELVSETLSESDMYFLETGEGVHEDMGVPLEDFFVQIMDGEHDDNGSTTG